MQTQKGPDESPALSVMQLSYWTVLDGAVLAPTFAAALDVALAWRLVRAVAASALALALLFILAAGVWAAVFTLPALLPAVAVLMSPLLVMPPVLVDVPAATPVLEGGAPVAALGLAWALPTPAEVPATPVVPADAPVPAAAPAPAARAGRASRIEPHRAALMQALLRVLFMLVSWDGTGWGCPSSQQATALSRARSEGSGCGLELSGQMGQKFPHVTS